MKKVFLSILALSGLAAQDDGTNEFAPTMEQLEGIKSRLEAGNKASEDLIAANDVLKSKTDEITALKDAASKSSTEIDSLKKDKKELEEKLSKVKAVETTTKKKGEENGGSGDDEITDDNFSFNKKADKLMGLYSK